MSDIYHNIIAGTITDNPLATGATTINSAAFANMPAVTAPDTLRVTLDPDGVNGLPEIVLVTAHTAAATSVTVTRGQETANGGNAAHSHPLGTVWRHATTRAAFEELPYRKTNAKGDLLVGTGDKAISRVAVGADNSVLTADSSQANGVKWVGPPSQQRVRVSRSTSQSIVNNTNSVVTFDVEDFDTNSIHSTVSNTSRLTVPVGQAGVWLVGYLTAWGGNAAGDVWVQLNGSTATKYLKLTGQGATSFNCSGLMVLADGDYIELGCFQASGISQGIFGSADWKFWMIRQGPS